MNRFIALTLLCVSNYTTAATLQATKPLSCAPAYIHAQFTPLQKKIAANYAIYAALSHNIYRNEPAYFALPSEWQNVYSFADSSGLNYQIYEKQKRGKLAEAVMVFSGTEDVTDWLKGNFTNSQYKHARPHIYRFVNHYKSVPKTLTGHSLGGNLAMRASYEFNDITAIGFNTNSLGYRGYIRPNTRIIISEKGDFAKKFSQAWNPKRWLTSANQYGIDYLQYDFIPPGMVRVHDSYPLAQGLIMLGSIQNPEVDKMLRLNCLIKP